MNTIDIQLSAGVMTVIMEAGGESDIGQLAVAYVIRNSCRHWGRTLTDEVFKHSRYSCWLPGAVTLYNLDQADDKAVARATKAMLAAWYYLEADPTVGAVFYLNKAVVIRQAGKLPDWWEIDGYAPGEVTIGKHSFRPPKVGRIV